mmetsp:Transcript_93658/g.200899  ORF Transcript_93658/g.200899 Transcript_93658/m.200899 type:complete len:311 (+) Transcript_93658:777-1709(+)
MLVLLKEGRQARPQLLASLPHSRAIEVGAARGRRRGGVCHSVCASLFGVDSLDGNVQGFRSDPCYLCVQTLSHLHSAMRNKHCAILLHMHQSPSLVEVSRREGNAEHCGHSRQTTLPVAILAVELLSSPPASIEVTLRHELVPHALKRHISGFHRVVEEGHVLGLVEVPTEDRLARHAELPRSMLEHRFPDEHALRPPEAPERRVGRYVGLADVATDVNAGDAASVGDVKHGPVHNGLGKVQGATTVAVYLNIRSHKRQALPVHGKLVPSQEAVSLPAHHLVHIAVHLESHRPLQLLSRHSSRDGKQAAT